MSECRGPTRFGKISVSLAALAVSLAAWAVRAETPPRVEVTASPSRITVGDLVRLTVTAEGPRRMEVEFPRPGQSLGPFEVRDINVEKPRQKDGQWIARAVYTLSIFETGEFKIPSLEIHFPASDGAEAQTVSTDEVAITVESVKPEDAKDILDIKPPLEIERAWWSYWPWLVPVVLAVLAYFLWRRRRRSAAGTPAAGEAPSLPPYEEAYQALCRLRESGLLEQQKVKLYYIELSEIIRRYFERRFGIRAMEMTSAEILDGLGSVLTDSDARKLFDEFLEACDLVKFAKWVPPRSRSEATTQRAFEILEATRPRAVSTPADQPAELAT